MKIKRILVSRTDKIGDLVLSIPSFYMLRKMYPHTKIGVLVRNYNYDIVKNLPYLDEVIKIDDYSEEDLLNKIKDFQADVFIALFSNSFIARVARRSGIKWRIGPYSKLSSFFSYNKGVWQKRSQSKKNEAEYNLDLIKSLNPQKFSEQLEINTKIYYEEEQQKVAQDFLQKNRIDGEIIVIHPFCGGSAKNLRLFEYREIIEAVLKEFTNLEIIVTAGANDEQEVTEMLKQITDSRVHAFINRGSILNLAAIIDLAKLYIGPSTGPTHIASSLGKKIIGIYPIRSTQSPTRWGCFNNEKVIYITPEEEKEEDYHVLYFQSYGEKDKKKIVNSIGSFLEDKNES